jgi:hypothetical protein
MATRHRKDLSFADFSLLARFCHALNEACGKSPGAIIELGVYTLRLPVWYLAAGLWQLVGYKEFTEEAIGIGRNTMEQVCKGTMREMLPLLYQFSMLSVTADTQVGDLKPRFRQQFSGRRWHSNEVKFVKAGFILEKRRALGGFRKVEPAGGGNGIYPFGTP